MGTASSVESKYPKNINIIEIISALNRRLFIKNYQRILSISIIRLISRIKMKHFFVNINTKGLFFFTNLNVFNSQV